MVDEKESEENEMLAVWLPRSKARQVRDRAEQEHRSVSGQLSKWIEDGLKQ